MVSNIHNLLKVLRGKHNLTQENLAKALNISRQTVNAIENEKYNPSIVLAFKIANYFNCKIEDIFIYNEESENGN